MLYRFRWWIFGGTIIALALCFTHLFGESVNGAARWVSLKRLGLRAVHFQPSEFAKLSCAIVLAAWFARQEPLTREFGGGFMKPGLIVAVIAVLIGAEVDLGSAALVVAAGCGIMFVAGTRLMFLVPVGVCSIGGFAAVVKMMPNRVERIMAFLDLEKYRDGLGLQQWRSLLAFGSGGLHGLGLGNGRQKMSYLPEAHTDFIFPMVGEEFGLIGTSIVIGLFVLLIVGGLLVAHRAEDRFGKLLAFGIILTLGLEALMNMGVTTALLPNKGLPLPFVSYGGSSLVAAMLGIGIVLNIHHQTSAADQSRIPGGRRR
ncbi:MAG: FtsW/RodA/SpoVE family cell cycle protein [Verrucomicrobia bacterium]|nr:FtsW/RodA/SpoVE family cell cycle protein [Verrucomicrobiota bacterium]